MRLTRVGFTERRAIIRWKELFLLALHAQTTQYGDPQHRVIQRAQDPGQILATRRGGATGEALEMSLVMTSQATVDYTADIKMKKLSATA